MALNTFVIINNITNLSDARYCAGMGVDVLGFTLEPGYSATVPQTTFKEITGWVAGVELSGEFKQMEVLEINQLAGENGLDYVQLNPNYSLQDLEKIEKRVIFKIKITKRDNLARLREIMEEYFAEVEYFLIDSDEITELEEETISMLRDLADVFPLILACGLLPDNILHVLEKVQPAGVALKGGSEIKPGLKDFNQLADILELLQPEED